MIWTYTDRTFIRQDENKPSFSFDWEEDLAKFKSHKSRLMLYIYVQGIKVHKVEHIMAIQVIVLNAFRIFILTCFIFVMDLF